MYHIASNIDLIMYKKELLIAKSKNIIFARPISVIQSSYLLSLSPILCHMHNKWTNHELILAKMFKFQYNNRSKFLSLHVADSHYF